MANLRERLYASAQRVISHVRDEEARVGNSRKIVLDEKFAGDHGLSRIARLDKNGSEFTVRAGPATLDRKVWWTAKVDDHVQDVEDMVKGKDVDLGRNRKDPKVEYKKMGSGVPHAYECQLLTKLVTREMTLVNPARGTLFRAKSPKPINVLITNHYVDRMKEIKEISLKEKQNFKIVREVVGIAYLGSNGMQDVRPEKWCCLIPNPYVRPFPYDNYVIQRTGFGMVLEYTRNDHKMVTVLRDVPEVFRYAPDQVDKMFYYSPRDRIPRGQYFFEITEELECEVPCNELEPVVYLKKYVARGENGYAEDKEYVYDVPGQDTYLSRYRRVVEWAKKQGKEPIPITASNNKFGVSFTSNVPQRAMVSMVTKDSVYTIINLNNQYYPGTVFGELYTTVYSPQFSRTNVPLPEGGEERIPFCPVTKKYQFEPVIPGTYFILPWKCTAQDFMYSIMTELYAKEMPAYRVEPSLRANFHHDYLDRQSKVIQFLISRPVVEKWDMGGVGEIEIAQAFQISAKAVFPLTRYLQGVYWYPTVGKNGPEMHYGHLNRVAETVDGKRYAEVLMDWYLRARLEVSMEDIDRVTAFLRVQGLPVVKIKYGQGHALIEGRIDDHARRRLFG